MGGQLRAPRCPFTYSWRSMCCQVSLHNITVTCCLVNTWHERVTPTICFAFVLCSHRKIISIRIFDREEYEKECSFSLVLEEPKWIRRGMKGVRVYKDIPARNCTLLSPCLLLSHLTLSSSSASKYYPSSPLKL